MNAFPLVKNPPGFAPLKPLEMLSLISTDPEQVFYLSSLYTSRQ